MNNYDNISIDGGAKASFETVIAHFPVKSSISLEWFATRKEIFITFQFLIEQIFHFFTFHKNQLLKNNENCPRRTNIISIFLPFGSTKLWILVHISKYRREGERERKQRESSNYHWKCGQLPMCIDAEREKEREKEWERHCVLYTCTKNRRQLSLLLTQHKRSHTHRFLFRAQRHSKRQALTHTYTQTQYTRYTHLRAVSCLSCLCQIISIRLLCVVYVRTWHGACIHLYVWVSVYRFPWFVCDVYVCSHFYADEHRLCTTQHNAHTQTRYT